MGYGLGTRKVAGGFIVGAVIACGSAVKEDDDAEPACRSGDIVECLCPDDSISVARCEDDGLVGVCDCPTNGGRGGTSAGGATSSGGNTSRGGLGGSGGTIGIGGSSGASGGSSGTGGDLGECSTASLPLQVVDVDYSGSLERLIVLGSAPNAVSIFDVEALTSVDIELPLLGSSVSVSPDGETAAVAHNGYVSIVDLVAEELTDTIATTTVAGDVVMGSNGFAYLLPESDQWVGIHSIDIAAGMEVGEVDGFSIYAGTLAKLHPGGEAMYGITVGLSPTDIEHYDITAGPVGTVTDSQYHGDYTMCGDIWISKDGLRIFTGCGTAFRAAPGTADDMTYNGALEEAPSTDIYGTRYQSIAHDEVNGKVYAIPASGSSFDETPTPEEATFRTFSYEFLSLESTRDIPCYEANATKYAMYGRYVFASSDGARVVIVAQAAGSALLEAWGVAVLDVE